MTFEVLFLIVFFAGSVGIVFTYARRTGSDLWADWKQEYDHADRRNMGTFWTKHWRLLLSLGGYAAVVWIVYSIVAGP